MTREEYEAILNDLREQERIIREKRAEATRARAKTINDPYDRLLNKKVKMVYRSIRETKELVGYWGGFVANSCNYFKPKIYKVKKDGTMSSRDTYIWVDEIISIEEVL
jgi:hypothetical protein